jgi:hypothetical protein
MRLRLTVALLAASAAVFGQSGQPDGNDIPTAIPIYFGQEISDIADSSLAPSRIYKISLGRGQRLRILVTPSSGSPQWDVQILRPQTASVKTLTNADLLACRQSSCVSGARYASISLDYQVPVAGDYFIRVFAGQPGIDYKLRVTAEGIPLDVPLPAVAECLTGPVDHITFSLRLISMNLPDSLSIGGVEACATCPVKPPLYSAIVEKLESALRSGVHVEACADAQGNMIRVKMMRP